jgi:hypothetical protein
MLTRHPRSVCMCLFVVVLIASASPSEAQRVPRAYRNWPPPVQLVNGSVAALLNPEFRRHAADCNIVPVTVENRPDRLFIPRDVIREFQDGQFYGPGEAVAVAGGSLAMYIYHENDILNVIAAPPVSRMLLLNYQDAPNEQLLLTPHTSFSAWRMSRSCAGYVGGRFEGGAAAPAVAAQLAAAADRDVKGTITALSGRFVSPLHAFFTSGGWLSLYQKLQLWRMYQADPSLINSAFYMREFDGVMMRRDRSTAFNVTSNARVSASIAAINADIQARYQSTGDFSATGWTSVIFSDRDNPVQRRSRFSRAPSVREILDSFGEELVLSADEPLRKGAPYEFSYTARGVPLEVCRGLSWTVDFTSLSVFRADLPRSVVTQHTIEDYQGTRVPTCVFRVRGTPEDVLFGAQRQGVALAGRVSAREQLSGVPASEASLSFPVAVNLFTTDEPVPQFDTRPYRPTLVPGSTGRFVPTWTVDVDFSANRAEPVVTAPAGQSVAVTGESTIACGNQAYTLRPSAQIQNDGRYRIAITAQDEYPFNEFEVGTQGSICGYEITITAPLARTPTGRTRQIPLNLRLEFPQRRLVPAPPAAVD